VKPRSNPHRLAASLALAACLAAAGSAAALAQATAAKKKVSNDADLPRFSYPVTSTASALLLADDATFDAFTRKVSADVESVLAGYDIQDNSTLRKFLGARLDLQMLAGDRQGAAASLATLRDLAEKPDAKAMSGLTSRAILQAWSESGATTGPAFQQAFSKSFAAEVNALPWTVVQDRIKGMKGSYQMLSTDFIVSGLKSNADRAALKSGTIDFDTAIGLIDDKEFQKKPAARAAADPRRAHSLHPGPQHPEARHLASARSHSHHRPEAHPRPHRHLGLRGRHVALSATALH
jgi:hypothetical protein